MTIDLTPYFQAMELDRTRLPQRAERGWLIEQASIARHRDTRPAPVRRLLGEWIIAIGERLRGMEVPEAVPEKARIQSSKFVRQRG